jgi:hypothetical protein
MLEQSIVMGYYFKCLQNKVMSLMTAKEVRSGCGGPSICAHDRKRIV